MKNCVICGKFLSKRRKRCCSPRCAGKVRGNSVIGTGKVAPYIMIRANGKTNYLHRCVWEKANGRKLRAGEVVHHKNGDKRDNRPENLEVVSSRAEHSKLHGRLRKQEIHRFQRHFSELGW